MILKSKPKATAILILFWKQSDSKQAILYIFATIKFVSKQALSVAGFSKFRFWRSRFNTEFCLQTQVRENLKIEKPVRFIICL